MPELPEVETVRNVLKSQILNKQIKSVKVFYEKMIETDVSEFKQLLIGETLNDIYRYGKYLFFIYDHVTIMSHLRMEGKYFIKKEIDPLEKHEHIEFCFTDGVSLRYHDTRKFGIMRLIKSTKIEDFFLVDEIKKLGKEAWVVSGEYKNKNNNILLTKEELFDKLHKSNLPMKSLLLDQTIICGLGNIYVDEVLFLSHLHPLLKGKDITLNNCQNIIDNCYNVLSHAVLCGGTTIRSYTSSLGVTGRFQINLRVHTKDGEACGICGDTILKTRVGGRGTYFCPTCQKLSHKIIGITGSIGTGKSTVSSYLKNKGYYIIDCDEIVHDLYLESKVKKGLVELFGNNIISNNQINYQVLRDIVFNNPDKLQQLNNYIHPMVLNKIKYLINCSDEKIIFIDVPLLFETHMEELFDEIWCVYSEFEQQIKRIMERNKCSYEDSLNRINKQMSINDKIKLSNITIDNSKELCYTYKQLDELITKF